MCSSDLIDPAEMGKTKAHRQYVLDAKTFLNAAIRSVDGVQRHDGSFPDFLDWQLRCNDWKRRYPVTSNATYDLVKGIRKHQTIVSDTGLALAWLMQTHQFHGERMIHAWNQTPMGYGIPAAIGAAIATGEPVTLIAGDGGFSAGIAELATIERRGLPIDIHILNNRGHGMCRQTQRQWLGGLYYGTSFEGGLPDLKFGPIGQAYGLELNEHFIDPEADLEPLVKFGHPNHDAMPLLPRDVLEAEVIGT